MFAMPSSVNRLVTRVRARDARMVDCVKIASNKGHSASSSGAPLASVVQLRVRWMFVSEWRSIAEQAREGERDTRKLISKDEKGKLAGARAIVEGARQLCSTD